METLAAKLRRPMRKALRFNLEMPMDSDFARAWCELVAHICHVSAVAPAALANEGVRQQYSRTLMEICWVLRRTAMRIRSTSRRIVRHHGTSAAPAITFMTTCPKGFRLRTSRRGSASRLEHCKTAFASIQPDAGGIHSPGARRRTASGAAGGRWTAGVTNLMMNVGIVNFGRYASTIASKSAFAVDDAKGKTQ